MGHDLISSSATLCYTPCPPATSFADFIRGNCESSCPTGTITKTGDVYGPSAKVCFETSCTISNCDVCRNKRCLKCGAGKYFGNSQSLQDSCNTCALANLDSDLTNGYGAIFFFFFFMFHIKQKSIQLDKSVMSNKFFTFTGACDPTNAIESCATASGGSCTTCLKGFLKEKPVGGTAYKCTSCVNNQNNLYPVSPRHDGTGKTFCL